MDLIIILTVRTRLTSEHTGYMSYESDERNTFEIVKTKLYEETHNQIPDTTENHIILFKSRKLHMHLAQFNSL